VIYTFTCVSRFQNFECGDRITLDDDHPHQARVIARLLKVSVRDRRYAAGKAFLFTTGVRTALTAQGEVDGPESTTEAEAEQPVQVEAEIEGAPVQSAAVDVPALTAADLNRMTKAELLALLDRLGAIDPVADPRRTNKELVAKIQKAMMGA